MAEEPEAQMNIDPTAEALGRTAVRWATAGDEDKLRVALHEIADSEFGAQALSIYVAVDAALLNAVFSGQTPNEAQVRDLVRKISAEEPWVPLTEVELFEAATSLVLPDYEPEIERGALPMAVFVIGGFLLARFPQALGYSGPWECLDATLNSLSSRTD